MTTNPVDLDLSFVPHDVRQVMERYRRSGFDVWLVGGALRDRLLDLPPKDWDLATNAGVEDTQRLFRKVVPVGARHGTVQVHTDLRDIEVTTVPGGGSEGILADLGRRDFTVNGLALSYPDGVLLDPHGGREDLQSSILRAVGDPGARFREDPLRVLRAGRFVSVYRFRIDEVTAAALAEESAGLVRVAQERIRDEMTKMLLGAGVVEAFEIMRICGAISRVLPELLEGGEGNRGTHHAPSMYLRAVRVVHFSPARLRIRLAALFHDLGGPRAERTADGTEEADVADANAFLLRCEASGRAAFEIMMRWRMSHKEIREVRALVENRVPRSTEAWSDGDVRRLMARVAPDLLEDLLAVARAERLASPEPELGLRELEALRRRIGRQIEQRPPISPGDLAVDGETVMNTLGMGPGPGVGAILRRLHGEVLENPAMNDREALIGLLKREYHGKALRRPTREHQGSGQNPTGRS
jgi:tRNA nucleotidyltransferase/poly(A) polymerase